LRKPPHVPRLGRAFESLRNAVKFVIEVLREPFRSTGPTRRRRNPPTQNSTPNRSNHSRTAPKSEANIEPRARIIAGGSW
jgi:hypothetical protein